MPRLGPVNVHGCAGGWEVTVEFLRKQLALGLDEINDGGLSGGDLTRWVKRLSGFEDCVVGSGS